MIRCPGLFVTGTDTNVGKTVVGAALLRLASRSGRRPVPYKPVETGCDPLPLDALALWRASGEPVPLEQVCPYWFRLPAAPVQAAAAEGRRLELDDLVTRAQGLSTAGDFLLVEGAGGLLVPYTPDQTAADLAARLGLRVLVVARSSLGTLNHVALTLNELARRHLPLAGVVLVETQPPGPQEPANHDIIAAMTGVRPLATLPYLLDIRSAPPEAVADALAQVLGPLKVASLLGSRPRQATAP